MNAGYKITTSSIELLHIGYDLEKSKLEKKYLRNLNLLYKQLEKTPNSGYYLSHLAKTLFSLNRVLEMEDAFKQAIANSENNLMKVQTLNYYALALFKLKKINEAINKIKNSLEILPEQADAYFILAEIYTYVYKNNKNRENIELALDAYLTMQNMQKNPSQAAMLIGTNYISTELLYYKIANCFFELNDFRAATIKYRKCLEINPENLQCFIGLIKTYLKAGKIDIARKTLEKAIKLNPSDKEIQSLLESINKNNDFYYNQKRNKKNSLDEELNIALNTLNSNKDFNSESINFINNSKNISKKAHAKKISLCMIVKNEEKMLADSLRSVSSIVDEIIIVDTGSTDKTLEIANDFNANTFFFPWIDDFSAARNESLKHATGDWILYLDADERLSKISANQIRPLINTSPENVGAYFCTIESEHYRLDGDTEKHRGAYPRIFRNLKYPKIKFTGRVHEQISPSIIESGKDIYDSDIIIEHLGYNLAYEEMNKKIQRNYKMLLAHVQEEPTNGYAWFQLGQTLGQMQLVEQAEEAVRFSIQCGNLSNSVYASAAATLSQFAGQRKKYEESLYWANESLSKVPKQIYGLSLKAHSLLYLGRKEEAEEFFLKAIDFSNKNNVLPRSGFDINISEQILLDGLKKSKEI